MKRKMGRVIFYSENKKLPFIIGIAHSNYDDTSSNNIYNSLTIYNIDKNSTHYLKLPKGELERQIKTTDSMFPEFLFDKPIIKGSLIRLAYRLKELETTKEVKKIILIDLKKYSR